MTILALSAVMGMNITAFAMSGPYGPSDFGSTYTDTDGTLYRLTINENDMYDGYTGAFWYILYDDDTSIYYIKFYSDGTATFENTGKYFASNNGMIEYDHKLYKCCDKYWSHESYTYTLASGSSVEIIPPTQPGTPSVAASAPVTKPESVPAPHTHDFVTGVIYDATCDHDGLEGTYCKTCGYILNSSPISAFGYTLETYAQQKIEASKSGQKVVLEFGELNSFPKSFMEKIAARIAEGVTFEFRYNVDHKLQKITIPAYSTVDTNLDWYGYAKMAELYGAN